MTGNAYTYPCVLEKTDRIYDLFNWFFRRYGLLCPIALLLCLLAWPAQADERFGLIFVYRTDCTASRNFSRSLKAVTDHYAIKVLPVSQNNARFAEWPHTVPDKGQSTKLNIIRVPFLALFDKQSGAAVPLTSRYLTPVQLEQRIAQTLEQLS